MTSTFLVKTSEKNKSYLFTPPKRIWNLLKGISKLVRRNHLPNLISTHFKNKKHFGFSLIAMMVSLFIMGFSMAALMTLMVRQEKGGIALSQKFDSTRLQQSLLSTMMNSDICTCHFTASSNFPLTLDTQQFVDIPMHSIRSHCDFSSQDNILAKAETLIPGSNLLVNTIRVTNIKFTGISNRYSGSLNVEYNQENLSYPMEASSIPLILIVDSESGTDVARPIKSCWKANESNQEIEISDSEKVQNFNRFYNGCMFLDYSSGEESGGRTLVGCNGTANNHHPPHSTALGYQAGKNSSNSGDNTYLGYLAGSAHSGNQSTFAGRYSGSEGRDGSASTAIGYQSGTYSGNRNVAVGTYAGAHSQGNENVFIGASVGGHGQGSRSVALGSRAALNISNDNVVLGSIALQNEDEGANVAIGYRAGSNFVKYGQILIGHAAGTHARGDRNIFLGYQAGNHNNSDTSTNDNILMGSIARSPKNGDGNLFLGSRIASPSHAQENTFVGSEINYYARRDVKYNTIVGERTSRHWEGGEKNVMIGSYVAYTSYITREENFRNVILGSKAVLFSDLRNDSIYIGHMVASNRNNQLRHSELIFGIKDKRWLTGDISSTGNLFINGQQVALTSSREIKKNIYPIKNIKKYVDGIIQAPLFTYHYKDKSMQPQKTRMGFISEELPEYLQIKKKGQLSHPDWPSIYGSFWASIQYIYGMLQRLKKSFSMNTKKMVSNIRHFHDIQNRFIEDTMASKKDLLKIRNQLSQSSQDLKAAKLELRELKAGIKEKWKDIENKFPLKRD